MYAAVLDRSPVWDPLTRLTMQQYQVVILRLQTRSREAEETMTDLLNERIRMGWAYHSLAALGDGRVMVVFNRPA